MHCETYNIIVVSAEELLGVGVPVVNNGDARCVVQQVFASKKAHIVPSVPCSESIHVFELKALIGYFQIVARRGK
jgi:hypothetical protein